MTFSRQGRKAFGSFSPARQAETPAELTTADSPHRRAWQSRLRTGKAWGPALWRTLGGVGKMGAKSRIWPDLASQTSELDENWPYRQHCIQHRALWETCTIAPSAELPQSGPHRHAHTCSRSTIILPSCCCFPSAHSGAPVAAGRARPVAPGLASASFVGSGPRRRAPSGVTLARTPAAMRAERRCRRTR